ncbi:uncharacterized protein A1O5_12655, partial [Cladophialophora psammophila CBS 110553]
ISLLLTRKVTQLQTLFSRRRPQLELTELILEALKVYQYGKQIYHHEVSLTSLSPLELSLEVNLTIRWHLACLLLVDMIERIEQVNGEMVTSRFPIPNIKMSSASAISAIAKDSLANSQRGASSSLPAGIGDALLNEPWTQILVSAM